MRILKRSWISLRMGRVQFQSNADREKVRQFFVKYQDRVLYGTDLTQEPGRPRRRCAPRRTTSGCASWTYLNTDQVMKVPELDAPVRGLQLPKDVVRKIYAANAERWFGNAWKLSRPPAVAVPRIRRLAVPGLEGERELPGLKGERSRLGGASPGIGAELGGSRSVAPAAARLQIVEASAS